MVVGSGSPQACQTSKRLSRKPRTTVSRSMKVSTKVEHEADEKADGKDHGLIDKGAAELEKEL